MLSAGHGVACTDLLSLNAADFIGIVRRTGENTPPASGFIQVIEKESRSHNPS